VHSANVGTLSFNVDLSKLLLEDARCMPSPVMSGLGLGLGGCGLGLEALALTTS